jgi:hydrogenase-4 component B
MHLLQAYIFVIIGCLLFIGFSGAKLKGIVAMCGVLVLSVISGIPAVKALLGDSTAFLMQGSWVTGTIPVSIDPLSGWFILIINFTMITSVIYGARYMQAYLHLKPNLTIHWICYILAHAGLIAVCSLRNSIAFLMAWEIMAVSAFFLVIFESNKPQTLKAGFNYLLQSHITILVLTLAFIWVASVTGTFDFEDIGRFAQTQKPIFGFVLMLLFFIGFGIKAGFVPFHTWLPHAHPAAPTHVSGMMSGVLIKIGIYGILRMLFLIQVNYLAIGYIILIISVITGVYGVMLAIVQHNLKKLLAYHSVENIGIIGMGIGLGCIGLGSGNNILAVIGFAGALLHTLNHSLFKSLLFYGAGNVYQSTHTMDIERFGGLIRQMPQTALLFLLASLAICGLPPFNGFVSEFIIYNGFLGSINTGSIFMIVVMVFALFGLALIGGLALLCFTKAFGTIFLGQARTELHHTPKESSPQKLIPMYMVSVLIILIGIFPQFFIKALLAPLAQMTGRSFNALTIMPAGFDTFNRLGFYMMGFAALAALIYFIRSRSVSRSLVQCSSTWGCGYINPTSKIQYSASSFVRSYRKLTESVLMFRKHKIDVAGVFPGKAMHQIHAMDKIEEYFIIVPLRKFRAMLWRFSFLQNGRLQFYILYGMSFIILMIGIPFIIFLIKQFVIYLNTL